MADRGGPAVPQLLGAAVGIVLGSVVLFAVIGMLRGDDTVQPEIAAEETTATPTPTDASPSAADEVASEAPAEEPSEDVVASPTEAPDAEATTDPEPDAEPSEAPVEEPTAEPTEQQTAPAGVEPGSVSIQVLDATGSGDTTAAEAVADELRSAGYDVVVVNRAGRTYDETTLFWSEGQAAAGQQVATQFEIGEAGQTPAEVQLSNSVDLHVVVGTDRA